MKKKKIDKAIEKGEVFVTSKKLVNKAIQLVLCSNDLCVDVELDGDKSEDYQPISQEMIEELSLQIVDILCTKLEEI